MEKINFFNEDVDFQLIKINSYQNWISSIISKKNKIVGPINYIFCSDNYLLDVNIEYLDHNYYTDIITFDYSENGIISGDLFISIDRVKENANTNSLSFNEELNRVMIHGILHLLGFKDKTEEEQKEMRKQENDSLKFLNN